MRANPADGRVLFLACGAMVAAAAFALAVAAVLSPRPAQALPAYARQTGLPCGQCHVNPAGGGPRTAFGRAFARNGHRLPGSKSRRRSRRHSRSYHHGDGYRGYGGMMGGGMMGGHGR